MCRILRMLDPEAAERFFDRSGSKRAADFRIRYCSKEV
jgi:hypothetical protein